MKLKDGNLLVVGMLPLILSVILEVFFEMSYTGFSITDFLKGLFVGLSITANLAYLIKLRLAQKNDESGPFMVLE